MSCPRPPPPGARPVLPAGPLGPRVYTSRLLGRDKSLVLHGGGNTSVKLREKNLFRFGLNDGLITLGTARYRSSLGGSLEWRNLHTAPIMLNVAL